MTKATPQVVVAPERRKPVHTAIVPGRRALGETWNRVDIYWNNDAGRWDVEITPTETPADGRGLIIPAAMTAEPEMLDFIIGHYMKEKEYRAKNPTGPSIAEQTAWINHAWQDYCAWKQAMYAGKSQFGPGGNHQKEKAYHK